MEGKLTLVRLLLPFGFYFFREAAERDNKAKKTFSTHLPCWNRLEELCERSFVTCLVVSVMFNFKTPFRATYMKTFEILLFVVA